MMLRLRLVNPNSDQRVTAAMTAVARNCAPPGVCVEGITSRRAVRLITNACELDRAAEELIALFDDGLDPLDGVIVSAFGDPGVEALRTRLNVPVIGIAEASLQRAATYQTFAICSTTPELASFMRTRAHALGLEHALACVLTTSGDPRRLMADPASLDSALAELVECAVHDHGAQSVVIGGGPLALATKRLAPISPVPIVEPVPAAVHYLCAATTPVRSQV